MIDPFLRKTLNHVKREFEKKNQIHLDLHKKRVNDEQGKMLTFSYNKDKMCLYKSIRNWWWTQSLQYTFRNKFNMTPKLKVGP